MTSRSRRKHIEAIQPQTRSEGVTIVKRLVTFLVSVAFMTGAAGFAVAQTSTQPTTPPPATTPAPAPKDKAAEKKAEMTGKMPAKNAAGLVKSASADSVVEAGGVLRSEEHTSELQSPYDLVCRLLLEKKKKRH